MASGDQTAFLDELADGLRRDAVVPVIGAGVSIAAAGLPSWRGALESAIDHLSSTRAVSDGDLRSLRDLLDQGDLVGAATAVVDQLNDLNELGAWLRDTFRRDTAELLDRKLLLAIEHLFCPIVATTNYDTLLSDFDVLRRRERVSWNRPTKMLEALREGDAVLHLHGVYDLPESVVLGVREYDQLAEDEAYAAVFRSLWLEHTLVFVGCSFDGLQDPDLSGLLRWARRAFPNAAIRHFALLRSAELTTERAAFLLRHRVQVVDYPEHAELPELLKRINPKREQISSELAARARALIDHRDPDTAIDLAELFVHLDGPADMTELEREATRILASRERETDHLRDELLGLQAITRSFVPERDLQAAARLVDGSFNDPPTADQLRPQWPTIRNGLKALQLYPDHLLEQLRQRGVPIHFGMFGGTVAHWAELLGTVLERGRYEPADDQYKVENAGRALRSLEAILRADALDVFPPISKGIGRLVDEPCVVVVRRDRIELRPFADPSRRLATLPANGPALQGAEIVEVDGDTMLLVHQASGLRGWRLHHSLDPSVSYEVADPHGIDSVSHLTLPEGLVTYVVTKQAVHRLVNLVPEVSSPLPGYHVLTRFVALPGDVLVACEDDRALVQIAAGREVATLIDVETLRDQLREDGSLPDDVHSIQLWGATLGHDGAGPLLVLGLGVNRAGDGGWLREAAAIVYRPTDLREPVAVFRTPRQSQLLSPCVVPVGTSGFRLVAGSLTDPGTPQDHLVVRSEAQTSGRPRVLSPDGELLAPSSFRAFVAMRDADCGWAGCTGALWELDFAAGTTRLIDVDDSSWIMWLDVLPAPVARGAS